MLTQPRWLPSSFQVLQPTLAEASDGHALGRPPASAHRSCVSQARVAWSALQLVGPDHLEVLADEDMVWPVDADVVNLVFAVAQLHHTIDDSPRIGSQRCFRRLVCRRSTDDRSRSLGVT